MSGSKNKIYYWDACVYLAWLRNEAAYSAELPMMAEIIRENSVRENTIITSTVTLIEVLSTKLTVDQEKDFRDSFRNPKHVLYDVDPAVAFKARELREYYVTSKIKNRSLSTPDSIYVATAMIHRADSFHTFDNGKSKDDEGKKGIPLLELGNKIAGQPLEIIKPFIHFTPSLLSPDVK